MSSIIKNELHENYPDFGSFLKAMREDRNVTLRELARKLSVSPPFLSDVEKGRSAPLTKERLEKVAEVLDLSPSERNEMYDIVGKQRNMVAPDVSDYVMGRDYVAAALRTARDLDIGEEEWQRFVEELRQREG